jgi:ribosomal protein L14E/L6E/L27E
MEYLRAWVWKERARESKGATLLDPVLVKHVEAMLVNIDNLMQTEFVKKDEKGKLVLPEIANMRSANDSLKNELSDMSKNIEAQKEAIIRLNSANRSFDNQLTVMQSLMKGKEL